VKKPYSNNTSIARPMIRDFYGRLKIFTWYDTNYGYKKST